MMKLPAHLTKYLFLTLLLLLTFVLYVQTGGFGFISVWDDNLNVLYNPYIKNLSFEGIRAIFSSNTPINEPRFTILTYAIDYKFWQMDPKMYHLGNVFLHLMNVALVFLLSMKLLKNVKISALVAALFAFHPFRIESVAWVSGRKDLLFTLFFLLAILFYIQYLRKEKLLWLLLVLVVSWLAFQSKIQAVTVPVTLLLVDVYFRRKLSVMVLLEKFLVAAVVLFNFFFFGDVMALLMFYLMFRYREYYLAKFRFLQKYLNNPGNLFYKILLRNAVILILFWIIYSLVFRALLSRFMPVSSDGLMWLVIGWLAWFSLEQWIANRKAHIPERAFIQKYQVWLVSAILVAGAGLAFVLFGNRLHLWNPEFSAQFSFTDQLFMAGYSLFCYVLYALFPFQLSSIRPYPDFDAAHLPTEYYALTVLVLLLVLSFAWALFKYKENRRILGFGFLFFISNIFLVLHIIPIEGKVILAERYTYLAYFGLFLMLGVFLNSISSSKPLWKHSGVIMGILLCGIFFGMSYRHVDTWKDEFTLLDDQIAKNPDYPAVYLNRSTLYINQADYIRAINDLDKAIQLDAGFYQAYYNRALAFSKLNVFDKAAYDCTLALRCAPEFADAHYLRAYAFGKMQHYALAIAGYTQALQLNPKMGPAYFNRGNARLNCREYDEALHDFDQTITLNPAFADAYSSRGVLRYFRGDYQASLADYDKAIVLSPKNGNLYFNRALSFKELNQHQRFCSDMQTALGLGYQPAQKVLQEQCP